MSDDAHEQEHEAESEGTRRRRGRHDDDAGDIVERWFTDHFPGSVVAGNTEIYNHVYKATEELKRRLSRR
jgi:hypothetical protein